MKTTKDIIQESMDEERKENERREKADKKIFEKRKSAMTKISSRIGRFITEQYAFGSVEEFEKFFKENALDKLLPSEKVNNKVYRDVYDFRKYTIKRKEIKEKEIKEEVKKKTPLKPKPVIKLSTTDDKKEEKKDEKKDQKK